MLDRRLAPPSITPALPVLPRPETEILPNGIELSYFPDHNQSITELELLFPAGSHEAISRQKEGYFFRMLGEGSRKKTSKQLADAISFLGAEMEFSHHPDYDTIHISCLSRFFLPMLSLLEEVWAIPAFPEKEWKTLQDTQIRQHEVNLQKTSFLAARLFKQKLYTSDLDYGYSTQPEFVRSLESSVFPAMYESLKSTGPALALLAGNAEKDAIEKLRNWLLHFSNCRQVNREKPSALPELISGTSLEEKPGSNQASLRMGHFTIGSRHPDSAILSLTLEIFGGYFGSRLMSNIREDKGWTYGIYAQRAPHQGMPHLVVSCDVNADASLAAVDEIRKEAEILQQHPADDEELLKVKNYILGQFLSSLTHVFGIAERYKSVWIHGTSFSRVEENQRIIREADARSVRDAANRYLNFDQSIICISGPKTSV